MDILKKHQTHIVLFCLMVFGFWLRFRMACVEDLATDEIATLVTASQSFPKGIIKALVTKNFHMPLYYFLLHFWILLFGDSAISLRLMPVLFGTLCIPAAYACGKELFSKFAGFSAAILVTINSFMISYSHFGKFYALLELLGFLSVYLIIKISKDPQNKYFVWLSAVNACIIYTYVIGFVFVGMQFLVFAGYDFVKNKKNLKKWIRYMCLMILLMTPIAPMILEIIKNTQNPIYMPGFWWYNYTSDSIAVVLMTWFSPAIPVYFVGTEMVRSLPLNFGWSFFWNVLPSLFAGFFIYVSARKERFVSLLLTTTLLFVLCEFVATLLGRFALVPRYTLLAFPSVVLAVGTGIALFSKRNFYYIFLSFFVFLNISYVCIDDIVGSRFSNPRNIILPLAHHLKTMRLHKGDKIFIPMRGYLLKYFYHPKDVDVISFDLNYVLKTGDRQIVSKLYSDMDIDESKSNGKQKLKRYITSMEPTVAISNYIVRDVVRDLNPDNSVVLIDSCPRPLNSLNLEEELLGDEISDQAFFYGFCNKVYSDIRIVLEQNGFHLQTSNTEEILVYKQVAK